MTTPDDLLSRALRRDGTRPLLTYYDDETGERIELSVATTANWVAKTANYLSDERDVSPDDVVGVLLPLHWQTVVVVLATWATGAAVELAASAGQAVAFTDDRHVAAARAALGSDAVIQLSLAPMGVDLSRLVAAQPDTHVALDAVGEDVVEAAGDAAPPGARVLTVLPLEDAAGMAAGLIGPLAQDGSVVQVRHPDAARLVTRCEVERVTHTVGVDVAGLPRLDR